MPSNRIVWLAAAIACAPWVACGAEGPSPAAMAAQIVRESNAAGGICAIVGARDAELALALAKQGPFVVHVLAAEPKLCDGLRKTIRERGMYGTVSADVLAGARLPYTDNLVNLVVASGESRVPTEEVLRVLVPNGVALVDGKKSVKPWPKDIDEWTHYLHGADGNPVAQDRVVGPPQHYQWVAEPLWMRSHESDSSVSTLVTARGRLFAIVDEAPISLVGQHPLPDEWFLVARDAFNGMPLWKVPIRRWGWREWKSIWFNTRPGDIPLNIQKRLVAIGDRVYVTLGYRAPVTELDARTGEILKTYADTERTGEILYLDGTLILSVIEDSGVRVMAVDTASGKRLWLSEKAYRGSTTDYIKWREMYGGSEPQKLDPSLNIATDGKSVALIDGPDIVCLDLGTGAERCRAAFPSDKADLTAGGIQSLGNLWIGTLIVRDGVVVHASPSKLAAFSADTGKLLWSQPKRFIGHLWYEWKDVFVIGGLVWTWSAELEATAIGTGTKQKLRTLSPESVNGYDLKTGELKKRVPLGATFKTHHHHRCYRNKATERYILASRRGTEFVDLAGGKHTVDNWVRGTCHVGMMPANGLQYVPPHPCTCYIEEKLNGLMALAPARAERGEQGNRTERGPAFGSIGNRKSEIANAEDWPAFRHDSLRTGAAKTRVPDALAPLWRREVGLKVSPPIAVGDSVFAALPDEHLVVCLDARDGAKRWEFAAGGRVDSPPAWHQGTLLFGSADGWAYCLRAADGQLAWRFRAAPEDRLIGAFGQLESAWPVHGSVLVQTWPEGGRGHGMAYLAAGRTSQLDGGIFLFALDPATGEVRHQARLEGPRYTAENIQQNFQLPMGALPDVLRGDGTNVYMRTVAFDATLQRQRGAPALRAPGGLLDGSYFKRTPWTFAGDTARLIVHDDRAVYYVRMFDSLRGLDPTVFFTPASKGYLLFAKNMDGKRTTWQERVPVRIRAMALAEGRLFVAGPPDVVDPKDPLGAFEGRKGGILSVVDTAEGKKLAELPLPSPPVFNGLAAANGRLYLAGEDGSITCLGKP